MDRRTKWVVNKRIVGFTFRIYGNSVRALEYIYMRIRMFIYTNDHSKR